MKSFLIIIAVVALLPACARKSDAPPAQTTFLISAPKTVARPQIEIRSFDVNPETIRRGEAVTAKLELGTSRPDRTIAVDWHAPDGWVVARQVYDAEQTRVTVQAPPDVFDKPGRYRAVVRSGVTDLAEDSVSVTG